MTASGAGVARGATWITFGPAWNLHPCAMKAMATAALAALIVMISVPALPGDAPKSSGSKVSSYAPQAHNKRRVYGAPIQPPIMGHRKSAHHKQGQKSAHATQSARGGQSQAKSSGKSKSKSPRKSRKPEKQAAE